MFGKTWDKVKEAGNKLSPFKQRFEESINETGNSSQNEQKSDIKENSHNEPPLNYFKLKINQTTK